MRIRNHLFFTAFLVATLGGGALLARDADAGRASETGDELGPVRAVGLMVNAPVGGGSEHFPDLAFFGSFEQTRVALQLRLEQGGIVDLVPDSSALTVFADDQGSNLLKQDDPFGPFEMMPRVSEDRGSIVFVAPSGTLPKPRARRLTLRGTVAVLVAEDTATASSATLGVADGVSFDIGPQAFDIADTGPSEWGEGWALTLVTERDPGTIVRYAFQTEEGVELELQPSMSMSMGDTWHQTLEVERSLQRGKFVIEYWDAPEKVLVPFDVSLGVGLD